MPLRRHFLSACLAGPLAPLLAACAHSMTPSLQDRPPILFVHGNGDSAALWQTILWRFESNGWPRERLFAFDQPYPLARDDDGIAQPGRSSSAESMAFLKARVEEVLAQTGAARLVLIGNSRGGNAIRNYVQTGGGDRLVSHAVLGGNPAHGIWAIKGLNEQNEFSGLSRFLARLNAPKNAAGDEVTPGVRWLTLRSDRNDKYAQPDGVWINAPGVATHISYDAPALRGATNLVLPGVDHRETSFSPAAFEATWRFLTGEAPSTVDPTDEGRIELAGRVTGLGLDPHQPASGNYANNLPLTGAALSIFAVDAATGERQGGALHRQVIGSDGAWGPLRTDSQTRLEFELRAEGYAPTHIYRSPFPRSSRVIHLRPERLAAEDRDAQAIVIFTRPRGYFDAQRDRMRFDGQERLPGVPAQGAGISTSKLRLAQAQARPVEGSFRQERVVGQVWPAASDGLTVLELTY